MFRNVLRASGSVTLAPGALQIGLLFIIIIISTALDVTEIIFAVLYVSVMGLTRCYKTTVFFNIYNTHGNSSELILPTAVNNLH